MAVYLIRHAQAGNRATWTGDDRVRPLTGAGRHQAADLVGWLADAGIAEVRSSPYVRCAETAAPLAARLSLALILDEALEEGNEAAGLALVRASWGADVALCSHGDVIPYVLERLAVEDGVDLGALLRCQKGSVWVLESGPERPHFASAKYLPPPRP